MLKKPIIVYWSYVAPRNNYPFVKLLDASPKPLYKEMFHGETGNPESNHYSSCVGAQSLMKNMFFSSLPFDVDLKLQNGNIVSTSHEGWWLPFSEPMSDKSRFDFDLGWTFFCEESLEIEITPPYFHKSPHKGFMAAGVMDISKWFRAINLSWILDKKQDSLQLEKNQPLVYFKFRTDRKVILKEFIQTEFTFNTILAVPKHTAAMGKLKLTLEKRYEIFSKSKMAKLLLREIKENLVDE